MPFEGNKLPRYYYMAIATYCGALSMGFVLGYSATALPGLQTLDTQLTLTSPSLQSWFASLMALAAMISGIVGGNLFHR